MKLEKEEHSERDFLLLEFGRGSLAFRPFFEYHWLVEVGVEVRLLTGTGPTSRRKQQWMTNAWNGTSIS
jgi:hypothetical protein